MRMRLYIAEKPSLGRDIARALGAVSGRQGYIECSGKTVVTWCFGHMFELDPPDSYLSPGSQDQRIKAGWKLSDLPIFPQTWKRSVKGGAAQQLKVIESLLRQAAEVVHAGDSDREGQLLVDEVLEHFRNDKPTFRLWLQSLDDASLRKALNNLRPNADFRMIRDAAEARAKADWLVGMNLTRAVTLMARAAGYKGVLSIGRVQTPTLALVVSRDETIEDFVSHDYHLVWIDLEHKGGRFRAWWRPDETETRALHSSSGSTPEKAEEIFDSEGRLTLKAIADARAAGLAGVAGRVLKYEEKRIERQPPLPYNLSTLQKEAGSKFGFSAQKTLDIAQSLYEKRVATYPRTPCRHLPEEQFSFAPDLLAKLCGMGIKSAKQADPRLRSAAWNTARVGDKSHHAIIPTGGRADLSDDEIRLFALIAIGYIRQFYPPELSIRQTAIISLAKATWAASGRRVTDPGWTAAGGPPDDDEETAIELPVMRDGDSVTCVGSGVETRKTSPPPHFTDSTLIDAMANIHRHVTNPEIKKRLKDNSGIGTEATRASIIETLIERGYLKRQQRRLISTAVGRTLIHSIPEKLADPGITAVWEDSLESIAAGKMTPDKFLEAQKNALQKHLEQCLAGD